MNDNAVGFGNRVMYAAGQVAMIAVAGGILGAGMTLGSPAIALITSVSMGVLSSAPLAVH